MTPGEIFFAEGDVVLNAERPTSEVQVSNRGDRPIQVGSHCHFFEVNRALDFDRVAAYGFRLDIPAGTAVRFEPGEQRAVRLVALGGRRVARGINGLVDAELDGPEVRSAALRRLETYVS